MSKELTPNNHIAYGEIISIIERARENAFRAVNRELISMYWEIGAYVSDKVKNSGWGKSVVSDFARFIQAERPDIKGFSASNIWRMRHFTRLTAITKNSHHWCEKLAGRKIC
ncbi:hypothetical protein ALO_18672 [Acetonema longum DSM 6540]|uniref:YhcG N-terminal domain-containing protein n=1 Tax=Acetonema longum DSM 6540 TaxID=1009370 RepID=F7NNP3_9FIRM|nr:DUF1016 N-terminal domain-containing protein [Acetonema longum]EGO62345.1 hypothetical protein ALO_18672 [Acetonema longum DSM 6540]